MRTYTHKIDKGIVAQIADDKIIFYDSDDNYAVVYEDSVTGFISQLSKNHVLLNSATPGQIVDEMERRGYLTHLTFSKTPPKED